MSISGLARLLGYACCRGSMRRKTTSLAVLPVLWLHLGYRISTLIIQYNATYSEFEFAKLGPNFLEKSRFQNATTKGFFYISLSKQRKKETVSFMGYSP